MHFCLVWQFSIPVVFVCVRPNTSVFMLNTELNNAEGVRVDLWFVMFNEPIIYNPQPNQMCSFHQLCSYSSYNPKPSRCAGLHVQV